MDKEEFLPKWINFSGKLEIVFGVVFALIFPILMNFFGIQSDLTFWIQFSGVSLTFMGIQLYYSARDVEKFVFIPIISSFYRFIVVILEVLCVIEGFGLNAQAQMFTTAIGIASIYDGGSALFTLLILKEVGYLKKAD